MGLDNGVILKTKHNNLKLPNGIKETETTCFSVNGNATSYRKYEIMYWRKCWALRNTLKDALEFNDNGKIRITKHNIHYLRKAILHYYFSIQGIKAWNSREMNYWGYDLNTIKQGLHYLYRVHLIDKLLDTYNDSCYIYFYDSF